jgi:hypothetical protein
MDRDDLKAEAEKVVRYIGGLKYWELEKPDVPYNHMDATITDAMLQAGVKYETVVRPRVQRLRREYPEATTTSAFVALIDKVGIETLLDWNHKEKLSRVLDLTAFLVKEKIETEQDLKDWIEKDSFNENLLYLVRGVGPKTLDYIKRLVGISTVPVDRHILDFLGRCGCRFQPNQDEYGEARDIVLLSAELMGVDAGILEHSIWKYMSEGKCGG